MDNDFDHVPAKLAPKLPGAFQKMRCLSVLALTTPFTIQLTESWDTSTQKKLKEIETLAAKETGKLISGARMSTRSVKRAHEICDIFKKKGRDFHGKDNPWGTLDVIAFAFVAMSALFNECMVTCKLVAKYGEWKRMDALIFEIARDLVKQFPDCEDNAMNLYEEVAAVWDAEETRVAVA